MATATSKTAIFKKAIVLLGSREAILSHDDAEPSPQSLTELWDISRRSALALHPWNFAVARAKLQRDNAQQPIGYAYRFERPADCLRWLPWDSDSPFHFKGVEEGEFFLSDDAEIFIRYICDHDDTTTWSPLFVDVMAYTLAFEFCEGKTGLKGLRNSLRDERDELLRQARKADGLATGERARRRSTQSSRWAGARFRNGVLGR